MNKKTPDKIDKVNKTKPCILKKFLVLPNLKKFIIMLATSYFVVVAGLYLFQKQLTYFPVKVKLTQDISDFPNAKEVWLNVPSASKVHAVYHVAPKGAATVIFIHGNKGNIYSYSDIYDGLTDLGLGVFMMEYPGYGKSEGTPSEDAFYKTARAAVRFLENYGVTKKNIVVFGKSLGTGVAVELASDGGLGGVILESPFTNIASVGQSHVKLVPVVLLLRERFDSLAKIGKIHCPLLITVASNDKLVLPAESKKLFEHANQPKDYYLVEGAGHNDMQATDGKKYWERLDKWFKNRIIDKNVSDKKKE